VNELFISLIEVMKEEAACYRRLCLLTDEQKELLVKGDVEALANNTRAQEKQVFALTPVIGRRNDLLARLASMSKVKSLSLKAAVKFAPVELKEGFEAEVEALVQAARELSGVQDLSGKLLENAMKFAQYTLKVIRESGKKKTYSMTVTPEKPSFVNRVI